MSAAEAEDRAETSLSPTGDVEYVDDCEEEKKIRRMTILSREGFFLDGADPEANDEHVMQSPISSSSPLTPGESMTSVYGKPLTAEGAAELCPPGPGLITRAQLLRDDCDEKLLKPRRPIPAVRASDFFASLVKTKDGRWVFHGVLNGWPGLQVFELNSITCKVKPAIGPNYIKRLWHRDSTVEPTIKCFPKRGKSIRATLRAPPWSLHSYSATSYGNVWWFHAQRKDGPKFVYGTNIVDEVRSFHSEGTAERTIPRAVRAHHFHHRYARGDKKETTKNSLTYHAAVLLEWDHGQYCTVVELATLNGVGGRYGKSNWFHDKLDARPALYRHMPAELVSPWMGQYAEIRCADVEAKNLDEFEAYMKKYEGPKLRFLSPKIVQSAPVRLTFNGEDEIARCLINYITRERSYTEEFRNCQCFAADFFGFLAGKKGIEPTVKVNRLTFTPRSYWFLYDARQIERVTKQYEGEE